MSIGGAALLLVAMLLAGPAKALLLAPEAPWGAAFAVGRLSPGAFGAALAAAAGIGLLILADRLTRRGRREGASPDPWRGVDLLAVLGAYVAAQAVGLSADVFLFEAPGTSADAPVARSLLLCDAAAAEAAAAAYLFAVAARRGAMAGALLGPSRPGLAAAGAAGAVGLGLLLIAAAAAAPALAAIRLPPLGVPGGGRAALALLLALEAAAVPLLEEILFRPFLFVLLRRRLPEAAAVGATALLFGLLHGLGPAAAPRIAGGALMTWLYARSGSVLPGAVVHAGFNLGLRLLPHLG